MKMRYYEVCPRGFSNELTYIRCTPEQAPAVEAEFAGLADRTPGAIHGWTDDKRAPSRAVNWSDWLAERLA
jgi:hypothetical protein